MIDCDSVNLQGTYHWEKFNVTLLPLLVITRSCAIIQGQIRPLTTALNQNRLHHSKLSLRPIKGQRVESPLDMKIYFRTKLEFYIKKKKKLVLLLKKFKNKFHDLKKILFIIWLTPFFLMTKIFFFFLRKFNDKR